MKGGILTADLVNTVSETYCREILSPEHGCGLEGVLKNRGDSLCGILNGIDYSEWDPAIDGEIFKNYSASAPSGKAANKRGLQSLLGLEQDAKIPLVGMVSRMIDQKGFDLLGRLLPDFAGKKMQMAVIGSGDDKYSKMFEDIRARGAGNIAFYRGFDQSLARRIYAGSDIFLMPSRFEPCGISQLIALRYGAVPVVRKTGGLADTVIDEKCGGREQSGFTFSEYSGRALLDALGRAFNAYKDAERWKKIVRSAMTRDFSWKQSAIKYEELYRRGMLMKGPMHG
jgi:starch synthase